MCIYSVNYALMLHKGLRKPRNHHSRDQVAPMPNGRCRMHGGASTGPRTPEGLQRIVKARTVHGAHGAEMRELRRLMRALNEEPRRALELVK